MLVITYAGLSEEWERESERDGHGEKKRVKAKTNSRFNHMVHYATERIYVRDECVN